MLSPRFTDSRTLARSRLPRPRGDGPDPTGGIGAEASTATALPSTVSHEDAVLAEVMMGHLTNQKAVIAFTPDPAGNDAHIAMYGIRGKASDIYAAFAEAKIENVTLVREGRNRWTAHTLGFHMWGGAEAVEGLIANARTVAERLQPARKTVTVGRGSYVGEDDRADARAKYDEVITAGLRRLDGVRGRDANGWWADLVTQWHGDGRGRGRGRQGVTKHDIRARAAAALDVVETWLAQTLDSMAFVPHARLPRPRGDGPGSGEAGPAL